QLREQNGMAIRQNLRRNLARVGFREENLRLTAGILNGRQTSSCPPENDDVLTSPTGTIHDSTGIEIANVDGRLSADADFLQFGSRFEPDPRAIGRKERIFRTVGLRESRGLALGNSASGTTSVSGSTISFHQQTRSFCHREKWQRPYGWACCRTS